MSYSSYLVGTWEKQPRHTTLQVVNPTTGGLSVVAGFFGPDGRFLSCEKLDKLDPNAMWSIEVWRLPLASVCGVVKIISYEISIENVRVPKSGIVGFQMNTLANRTSLFGRLYITTISEAPLAAVSEYAAQELESIWGQCP